VGFAPAGTRTVGGVLAVSIDIDIQEVEIFRGFSTKLSEVWSGFDIAVGQPRHAAEDCCHVIVLSRRLAAIIVST
jgi:hypothetical protein